MFESMPGGCSCGAVRYKLLEKPLIVHCCHCRDCQTQTGGAFAINAMIETKFIAVEAGDIDVIAMPSPSGSGHDIHRCAACRVAVWSDYGRRPFLRFLRVSTLKDAHAIAPDVHIFTRSKVPWVTLPRDVPAFDVYYDIERQWRPDSLARRAAMLAAAKQEQPASPVQPVMDQPAGIRDSQLCADRT
jgi:hypothetical protein